MKPTADAQRASLTKASSRPNRNSLAARIRRRLIRLGYQATGSAFARERRVARRGQREYRRFSRNDEAVYKLRRNIHRIEKGLIMRPVRNQFATDYIEETVATYSALTETQALSHDHPDVTWAAAVLDRYFEATIEAEHPSIQAARARFDSARIPISQHGPHPVGHKRPTIDIADLERLAQDRRSVRWFTSEPVDRSIIDRAVSVGAESPTACNRQPYRFEIFDDPASASRVAAVPMGADGYSEQVPGIIVIVGDLSAFFDYRDRHLIYIDACLASMGLVYALEAQGVSTCCINWPDIPEREHEMRRLIGLAPHERVVMLLAFGYADPEALVPFSAKRPLEEVRRFRSL